MTGLTLDIARKISDAALAKCRELKLKPMAIAILDARGTLKTFIAEDNTSLLRGEVAHGKAYGALALGMGSRAIFKRATEQPYFVDAINTMARGALVPVPGGVLINDKDGNLLGAIGISGDTSDNDEAAALAGIAAAGLVGNAG
ncbi:MAG TPA: heme-binding protein [Afipia sp.]